MLKYKNNFVILILLLLPAITFSQAIKFNYIGYSGFQSVPGPKNLYYGFGYEQNIGSRISLSLEYNKGYKIADDVSSEFDFRSGAEGFTLYYLLDFPWNEFSYTSKYFFSDNDESSWYISTGIAYRSVTNEMIVTNAYSDPAYESEVQAIQQGPQVKSVTMIPISFKGGWRGSMDGWFSDVNLGFSFIPGASSNLSGNATMDKYIKTENFNNICITFGCSFGIGWAK